MPCPPLNAREVAIYVSQKADIIRREMSAVCIIPRVHFSGSEDEASSAVSPTALSEYELAFMRAVLSKLQGGQRDIAEEMARFIERADSACLAYKGGTVEEKRDLLDSLTSDRILNGKVPTIMLSLPFSAIAERHNLARGSQRRFYTSDMHDLIVQANARPTFRSPARQSRLIRGCA